MIIQLIRRVGLLALVLAPIFNYSSLAQDLTGIWRGYFITAGYDQYKFELQIKQSKGLLTGVSYSYHNTEFYGKATLTGNYNKEGNRALIREIKTVEVRMASGSSACIMKCLFEYSKSGNEEFLEGTFTSVHEKDGLGHAKGDDCGGGKVYLRRVVTSDFYIEPFLRDKPADLPPAKKTPVIIEKDPVKKSTSTAKTPTTKPTTTKPKVTKPIQKPVVRKPSEKSTVTNPGMDSLEKISSPPVLTKVPPIHPTPNALKTRTNELVKLLVVHDENVTVKLYDNGEIDDDTISVYMDKKLVLSAKRLTASPLVVKLKMDEDNSEHELVMVAENLGRIPPNTSLMIVESGDQRFDVRITSTEQKNAMVRFRYEKK